ncbi:MAG: aspartate carbamoyltransferase [Pseudomonadota bacterium]
MQLCGNHIISVEQFNRDFITELFDIAELMRPYANRQKINKVLDGAILGNMFFEPSTRTRVSFGCAFNLLGGFVRETVGFGGTSIAKGESLYDTAKVMSGYSDVIVMRHPEVGSVKEFATASRVPVINGGDGPNEHPSQALLDLFTIQNELTQQQLTLDELKITMVGDLKHGRTVHSLSKLLSHYQNIDFCFVAPEALQLPTSILDQIANAGHRISQTEKLDQGLSHGQVVYQTRIQEERFATREEADKYRGAFRINQHTYAQFCQPTSVIMHPLPRDSRSDANELDNDLNENPHLAIFRQSDNGVLVRMALFAKILGVEKTFQNYELPVTWKNNRQN